LWAGVPGAILKREDGRWTIYPIPRGTSPPAWVFHLSRAAPSPGERFLAFHGEAVTSFAQGPDDVVLAGTRDGGLLSFDGTRWRRWLTAGEGLAEGPILGVAVDAAGATWVGTHVGVSRVTTPPLDAEPPQAPHAGWFDPGGPLY
jgi:hypothetical protein